MRLAIKIIRFLLLSFIFLFIYSCEKEKIKKDPGCLLKRCEIIENWGSGEQIDTVIWIFDYSTEGLLTKYIQKYSSSGDEDITEIFFYDENMKLERMDLSLGGEYYDFTYRFIYNQNNIIMEEWDYTGDTIAFGHRKFIYEFNSRNELVKWVDFNGIETPEDTVPDFLEYKEFKFENGNVVKSDDFDSESLRESITYTYDNKKNPLSEQSLCWIFNSDLFLSSNNILTGETYNPYLNQITGTRNITYEYNEYGYPVEMISSQTGLYHTKDETWTFEYECDSI
jgi:hypothetical protein